MQSFRKICFLLVTLTAFGAGLAHAEISSMDQALDIAGQQRMLSQRIVKAYLLMGQDILPDKSSIQLHDSVAQFESQLADLEGYLKAGEMARDLKSVRKEWTAFRKLATTAPNQENAAKLIQQSEELLSLTQGVTSNLEKQVASTKGRLINISNEQGMLSQKIAMYYSAMSWNLGVSDLENDFKAAVKKYDAGLSELRKADANSEDINKALDKVISQWSFSHSGFEKMDGHDFVPFVIATTTESMLKSMRKISDMYAGLKS
ncbi:pilus assembly protein PilP [Hahella sp. KA22]|nr:pilus assembly protein PilP [Hahella sp. KA22]QAY53660.1 pilus assembly protein PilP [Hahella sp. KA22]